jgi:hypothetical protein
MVCFSLVLLLCSDWSWYVSFIPNVICSKTCGEVKTLLIPISIRIKIEVWTVWIMNNNKVEDIRPVVKSKPAHPNLHQD